MDSRLASITESTLSEIPFTTLSEISWPATDEEQAAGLVSISRATHGDCDVSMYEGFDLIVAERGTPIDPLFKGRFAAILRRRSDGALRLIRTWATDEYMDGDTMVPHERRHMINDAFSTHSSGTRLLVSRLADAFESTPCTEDDVRAHDASVLKELAWHTRRAAARTMTPSLSATLTDTARDMTPAREVVLVGQRPRRAWFSGFSGEPWYVGYRTTIGREHATNFHHLKALAQRLHDAGDTEAASTLHWLGWRSDLEANRYGFLTGEATRIQEERVAGLEAALQAIADLPQLTHSYTDSTMRQNPTECLSVYSVTQLIERALEESRSAGASYDAFAGKDKQ